MAAEQLAVETARKRIFTFILNNVITFETATIEKTCEKARTEHRTRTCPRRLYGVYG